MNKNNLEMIEVNTSKIENETHFGDLLKLLYKNEMELDQGLPIMPIERIKLNLLLFIKQDYFWRYFLLYQNTKPVGYLKFTTNLESDKHMSSIHVFIDHEFRRNGYSKYLFSQILDLISKDVTVLEFLQRQEIGTDQPKLHELFTRLGGKQTYFELINVSNLSKFDQAKVKEKSAELISRAESKGYKIEFYENGSFKDDPNFDFPSYVSLMERINNDMPREESTWEDEKWDEEKLMKRYKTSKEKREKFWAYIAIHSETNNPAGMTEVVIQEDFPTMIDQLETGVLSEYRGNKLGLTLKYAVLNKILQSPETQKVELWKTENANSNSHMLAINDELGYKPLFAQCMYEVPRHSIEKWAKST